MPTGLEIYNEAGQLVFDATKRITRLVGFRQFTLTSNANGQIFNFPNVFTGNGTPFVFRINAGNAIRFYTKEGAEPFVPYSYDIAYIGRGFTITIKSTMVPSSLNDIFILMCGEY